MDPDLSASAIDVHRVKMSQQNENIQVFVRVRPMNGLERNKNSLLVLDCPGTKEVVVRERSINNLSKTFTFDRVFSPISKQIDVYKVVVAPLLEEVLLGYNCTVFAYGQTGTGKTFTMEGERSNDPQLNWENDPMTGIVPRALSQLFDELRLQNVEFTVRVSLLELYNEELFDLLSPSDDFKLKQLRLFEDSHRKGSVIIQGLEEVTVHNKHEVYHIMERGTERRRTAATQMNATSSRSHTVFTVTVHIKESNMDGEELIKIGKLHLVDLAGSENIGRSGAVDKRAREAGSINQSLLTLGRVITSLVERGPHVPYRESKLTRILQDSLGGRTKTSIIATVSPASYNLEETLSTLDYAHRAKNIMNRPEINQKLTKKAVMKEFTEEIERLRRDLMATREKNGIFLDKENYEHMTAQIESQGQDLCEKITQNRGLQENLEKKEEEILLLRAQLEETKDDLDMTKQVLGETRERADRLQKKLVETELERDQQEHLVDSHVKTEKNLSKEAEILLQTTEETTVSLDKLYRKLDRKKQVEQFNVESGRRFKADLTEQFSSMCAYLEEFRVEHSTFCGNQRLKLNDFVQNKETQMAALSNIFTNFMQEMKGHLSQTGALVKTEVEETTSECRDLIMSAEENHKESKANILCSKDILVKYGETLLKKLEEACGKLRVLEIAYTCNLEEQGRHVDKFVNESTNRIEAIQKNIDGYMEGKEERYLEFQTHIFDVCKQNNKFMKNLKADANNIISEVQKLIENTCNYEKETSEELKAIFDTGHASFVKENDYLTNLRKEFGFHREDVDLFKSSFMKSNLEMHEARKQDTTEFKDVLEHAASTAKFMRGASLEGFDLQFTIGNQGFQLLQHKIQNLDERGKEFARKYFAQSKSITERGDEGVKAAIDGIEVAYDADICFVGDGKKEMEGHCTQFSQCSENIRAKVLQQSGKLGEFWESTYLVDLPTGMTPQKKAYEFPRNLSATSPHETILERFTNKRREEEKNEIF